jgi:hypothetical protein
MPDIVRDSIEVFETGQKTVGTSVVQLTASERELKSGLLIKATSTNAASVFIGGPSVTTSTGYELVAGDEVKLFTPNGSKVYAISGTASQSVSFLAQ